MPKAILEFDLSDPDEDREFDICRLSHIMRNRISEFNEILRRAEKYGSYDGTMKELSQPEFDLIQKIRSDWLDLMNQFLEQ